MKFSIFTGFYENIETFEQLVNGVLSQTYDNWEWLIADDFSSNPEVKNKMISLAESNRKIKIVEPSFKKEFYWNPPVSHSTGDIFMVHDSDDFMHPRLLEVYKHNFEKFPEVQMISTNSVIANGSINGNLRAVRHINYGKNCNSYQSYKDLSYEYNWGDCRAWRNNVKSFCEPDEWKYCAEDALKVTFLEEIGKILYLPRTLHTYAHRENSISHLPQADAKMLGETGSIFENANGRKDRRFLNSVHDYYDRIFSSTTAFYLSAFNYEKASCEVNYFYPKLNPREMEVLKDLYFDQDLKFNSEKQTDYLVVKLTDSQDVEKFEERLKLNKPRKQMCIEAEKSIREEVNQVLERNEVLFGWFLYTHYNTFSNFDR
jgi:glycosyltransferase involved in cell wall biosynthesis